MKTTNITMQKPSAPAANSKSGKTGWQPPAALVPITTTTTPTESATPHSEGPSSVSSQEPQLELRPIGRKRTLVPTTPTTKPAKPTATPHSEGSSSVSAEESHLDLRRIGRKRTLVPSTATTKPTKPTTTPHSEGSPSFSSEESPLEFRSIVRKRTLSSSALHRSGSDLGSPRPLSRIRSYSVGSATERRHSSRGNGENLGGQKVNQSRRHIHQPWCPSSSQVFVPSAGRSSDKNEPSPQKGRATRTSNNWTDLLFVVNGDKLSETRSSSCPRSTQPSLSTDLDEDDLTVKQSGSKLKAQTKAEGNNSQHRRHTPAKGVEKLQKALQPYRVAVCEDHLTFMNQKWTRSPSQDMEDDEEQPVPLGKEEGLSIRNICKKMRQDPELTEREVVAFLEGVQTVCQLIKNRKNVEDIFQQQRFRSIDRGIADPIFVPLKSHKTQIKQNSFSTPAAADLEGDNLKSAAVEKPERVKRQSCPSKYSLASVASANFASLRDLPTEQLKNAVMDHESSDDPFARSLPDAPNEYHLNGSGSHNFLSKQYESSLLSNLSMEELQSKETNHVQQLLEDLAEVRGRQRKLEQLWRTERHVLNRQASGSGRDLRTSPSPERQRNDVNGQHRLSQSHHGDQSGHGKEVRRHEIMLLHRQKSETCVQAMESERKNFAVPPLQAGDWITQQEEHQKETPKRLSEKERAGEGDIIIGTNQQDANPNTFSVPGASPELLSSTLEANPPGWANQLQELQLDLSRIGMQAQQLSELLLAAARGPLAASPAEDSGVGNMAEEGRKGDGIQTTLAGPVIAQPSQPIDEHKIDTSGRSGTAKESDASSTPSNHELFDRLVVFQSSPLAYKNTRTDTLCPVPLLDFDREAETLNQSLQDAKTIGANIEIVFETATTDRFDAFFAQRMARVMHLSCHGHEKYLALENGSGGMHSLYARDLSRYVAAGLGSLRVVVVSACHSLKTGQAFINAGVPHVVCCQHSAEFNDVGAAIFAGNFYRNLACKRNLKEAFIMATEAVRISPLINDAKIEAEKFVLLPQKDENDEYHNVQVFFTESVPPRLGGHPSSLCSNIGVPLPRLPESFLGRELNIYKVLERLRTSDVVRIAGAPGVGKGSVVAAVCRYMLRRPRSFPSDYFCWFPSPRQAGSADGHLACSHHLSKAINLLATGKEDVMTSPEFLDCWENIVSTCLDKRGCLVIDNRPFVSEISLQNLEFFLRDLLKIVPVKVIVISRSQAKIIPPPVAHNRGEVTIEIGPLDFYASAVLFGSRLTIESNGAVREVMASIVAAAQTVGLSGQQWQQELFLQDRRRLYEGLLGNGIPTTICRTAANLSASEFFEQTQWWTTRNRARLGTADGISPYG